MRPAVREEILGILGNQALRGKALAQALLGLGSRHAIDPFRSSLRVIACLDRDEAQARLLMTAIEEHRASLEARLGRDPGFSVAALDYLHELEGTIREPVFSDALDDSAAPQPATIPWQRPFDETLALELRRAARFGRPLSLVLLGPDSVPPAGESSMTAAARSLRGLARDSDEVARVVPEGFAVILPGTGEAAAAGVATRLISALRVTTGVSWSAGIVAGTGHPGGGAAVAREAGQTLARARARGGGAIECQRAERREHPRRRTGPSLLAWIARDEAPPSPIAVEDLSIGGALLRGSEKIDPGSEVDLTLREVSARPREVTPRARIVRVVAAPEDGPRPTWRTAIVFLADDDTRCRIAGILADLTAERRRDAAERA
ncbi:MAG TPA: hypothetical protein VFT43_14485 [Candidatus Polarisedimenticolia bacterium]|nr:hypothetical protein [Candidatus Polarisedimenticolia bacterium]